MKLAFALIALASAGDTSPAECAAIGCTEGCAVGGVSCELLQGPVGMPSGLMYTEELCNKDAANTWCGEIDMSNTPEDELDCASGLITCPINPDFSYLAYEVVGSNHIPECVTAGSTTELRKSVTINITTCNLTQNINDTHVENIITLRPQLPPFVFGKVPNDGLCGCSFQKRLTLSASELHGIEQEAVTQNTVTVDGATMLLELIRGNATLGTINRFRILITGQLDIVKFDSCYAEVGAHRLDIITGYSTAGPYEEALDISVTEDAFETEAFLNSFYARDSASITFVCTIQQCRNEPCPASGRRLTATFNLRGERQLQEEEKTTEMELEIDGDDSGVSIDSMLDFMALGAGVGQVAQQLSKQDPVATEATTPNTMEGSTSTMLPVLLLILGSVLLLVIPAVGAFLYWKHSKKAAAAAPANGKFDDGQSAGTTSTRVSIDDFGDI